MKLYQQFSPYKSEVGAAGLLVLFFFVLLLCLFLSLDYGYIFYSEHCPDLSVTQCLSDTTNPSPVSPTPAVLNQTIVTATGNISVNKYQVTVSLDIPLQGGAANGHFSGDCTGSITGTYTDNNHTLSGKAAGSCNPFLVPIPASAVFTGSVNPEQKSVPISGTGSALGYSGTGSLTLTY